MGKVLATVAVLYFDYAGKSEDLAVLKKGLAQILISDLSRVDNIQLVERERLEAVLAEQKLATSGNIDPKTAAKIGKLLGARYLVLGSYFDLNGVLRIDARLVEVETSKIITSVGSSGELMDAERKIAEDLGKTLATAVHVPPPARVLPAKLTTKNAVHYSKALDAKDKGDKETAKRELHAVLEAQPDFRLADKDLKRMEQ